MITRHNKESLRAGFVLGVGGIFSIIDFWKKPFKPILFKIALGCCFAFLLSIGYLKISLYNTIIEIVSICTSLLPGILGFTIGGYSFLIGFVQTRLMEKISEPQKDSKFSLFQEASASFAANIIIQAFTLILAYAIHLIIYLDTNAKNKLVYSEFVQCLTNAIGLIIISVFFSLSLAIIMQLVVNVFNFSQLHHYDVNKSKVDEINAASEANQDDSNSNS